MSHVLLYAKHPKNQPVLFSKEGTEWMKMCTVYNATIQTKNSWILIVGPTCTFCPSILHFLSNPSPCKYCREGKSCKAVFKIQRGRAQQKADRTFLKLLVWPLSCPSFAHPSLIVANTSHFRPLCQWKATSCSSLTVFLQNAFANQKLNSNLELYKLQI